MVCLFSESPNYTAVSLKRSIHRVIVAALLCCFLHSVHAQEEKTKSIDIDSWIQGYLVDFESILWEFPESEQVELLLRNSVGADWITIPCSDLALRNDLANLILDDAANETRNNIRVNSNGDIGRVIKMKSSSWPLLIIVVEVQGYTLGILKYPYSWEIHDWSEKRSISSFPILKRACSEDVESEIRARISPLLENGSRLNQPIDQQPDSASGDATKSSEG